MSVRLWIDDLRPAPDGWRWAKSSREAIDVLAVESVEAVPPTQSAASGW